MEDRNYLPIALDRLIRATREKQYCYGLVPSQWEALRYLYRANKYSRTPGIVADFLGTTKGTASQTLRSLESKGYIRRIQDQGDKRITNLELTDTGRSVLKQDPLAKILNDFAFKGQTNGDTLLDGLQDLLDLMKPPSGRCQFGYCSDCANFRSSFANPPSQVSGYCSLNGDTLPTSDMTRICAKFSQSEFPSFPSAKVSRDHR